MSQPRVVVHVGPTVSVAQVRDLLPQAVVRAPAARGDLLAGRWRAGDVAVVIDGYFRERRSVGHKEILWLLGQGVTVVGGASMGALRAAELAPYGMVGIGTVYRMYASGEIDGDDEVGVLHGPAELGYPAATVAVVNLRYAAEDGAQRGLFRPEQGARIVAAASALPFTHRTWADLARALDRADPDAGLDPADQDALQAIRRGIESGEWDLKHLDALAVLRAVAGGALPAAGPTHAAGSATVPGPVAFTGIGAGQLLDRSTRQEYAPGRWFSDLDVLDAARLYDPDYPGVHEEVLTGLLAGFAADRGLTPEGFARAKLGLDGGRPLPPRLGHWLTPAELAGLGPADQGRLVMVRVWPTWQSFDWRPAVIARLRASGRWQHWCDRVVEADDAAADPGNRVVVPPAAICGQLFLRHWRSEGATPAVELARRGFTGPAELGAAVRRFFVDDVRRGRARVPAR